MPRSKHSLPRGFSAADLQTYLGDIPLCRIRLDPPPGKATERDVERINAKEDRLYELVDGILVEKPMGFRESFLAVVLLRLLGNFVEHHKLGILTGADGTIKLAPKLVRIPDAAFFSWKRLPGGKIPKEAIPELAPDLAAEVLSESNTQREMERKLKDYFLADVRLVWLIDPESRTAQVYTAPDQCTAIGPGQALEGGDVVPGFRLPLAELFAKLDNPAA